MVSEKCRESDVKLTILILPMATFLPMISDNSEACIHDHPSDLLSFAYWKEEECRVECDHEHNRRGSKQT
jgi:hypothetical protein